VHLGFRPRVLAALEPWAEISERLWRNRIYLQDLITPEAERLHVSLGRAYLNLGETEKSMTAFEEAIKLNRTAGV